MNKPNRYPSRHRQPPNYLQDYDVNNYSEFEDYVNSVDYCYFLNAPVSYEDVMKRPDTREWKRAMTAEIDTLNENETFITTNLPEGKSLVGGKWVFAVKGDPEKPIYKARYVAKGYSQVEGLEFTETFSPTARMESVRALVQIACQNE